MRMYSLTEAAQHLNINRQTLLQYRHKGVIKFKMMKPHQLNTKQHYIQGIDEPTMQRIRQLIHAQVDPRAVTLRQFSNERQLVLNEVRCFVHNHKIQPIQQNDSGIGSRYYLYNLNQLNDMWQAVHNDRTILQKLNLTINTETYYDDSQHVSLPQLVTNLTVPKKIILKWMGHHQIPYQIDANYKIYFTNAQQQQIIDQYHHVPDDLICVKELARQLNITSQTLNSFIQYYRFQHCRVIGDAKRYYDPKTVATIKQYYHRRRQKKVRKEN